MRKEISVFWFRRDLRLEDNSALFQALKGPFPVLVMFIFDNDILEGLNASDPRVSFIYQSLKKIHKQLITHGAGVHIYKGKCMDVWKALGDRFRIKQVYVNRDYEPYALQRDLSVRMWLEDSGGEWKDYKDQVIFEAGEVLKADGQPYTVFTPYSRKWKSNLNSLQSLQVIEWNTNQLLQCRPDFPEPEQMGLVQSQITVSGFNLSSLEDYGKNRDHPSRNGTSRVGPHLRFGTMSIRKLVFTHAIHHEAFLNELIWREFYMQVLFYFPDVSHANFKKKYDNLHWLNQTEDFDRWCKGLTGYPLVDAGMRELNSTGFMHNRVRMVTASFLCKHLLIDWRWGEAYFAQKLLDYELASNNGNWQWAAGTGCDAAPYFRIFNPMRQQKRFDKNYDYIKQWIPELEEASYPAPMIDHKSARLRALQVYKEVL